MSGSSSRVHIHFREKQIVMVDFGPKPNDLGYDQRTKIAFSVFEGPLSVSPEMTKVRQCVVIKHMNKTLSVVPLSTQVPINIMNYHFQIPKNKYRSLDSSKTSWIKANLITSVSERRVFKPYINGTGIPIEECLDQSDYDNVKKSILHGLGMGVLSVHI